MKWIGQHIYDLVSRFRDDVYLEDLSTTTETNVLVVDSNGKVSKSTTLADDIIESEIDTLAGLTSFGAAGATTNIVAGDLTMYNPVNDGNPTISLGSSATNRFEIQAQYNSGAQTLDEVNFTTYTTSGTTNDGRFVFNVDEVEMMRLLDSGLNVVGNVSVGDADAQVSVTDTTASSATQGGKIRLRSNDGAVMADDHRLGVIEFYGAEDTGSTCSIGARIQAIARDAWDGSNNDADLEFYTTDGTTESKVLTLDADKLATFAGAVTVTGALTGTLATVSQPNITGVGTIGTGTWRGTAITAAYIAAAQTNITSLGTLTALDVDNININEDTITASEDLAIVATGNDITVDTDNFTIESAGTNKPSFTLKATQNSNKPAEINFVKDKGAAGAAGDFIGQTYYISDNDAQEQITMVNTHGKVSDATDGAEEGEYKVAIKNTAHASVLQDSFVLTGNGAHTDATIGYGTSSVTTLTGSLTMGSTAAMTNAGLLGVANQSTLTGVGTIGTGTWQGTRVASLYLDADTAHLTTDQTFTGAKTFDKIISAVFDGDKSVTPRDGTKIHIDAATITDSGTSASGTATNNHTVVIEAQTLAATNASVTNTHAASLYISDAPTAGTNMTLTNAYALWVNDGLVKFDGALTVDGTITGDVTGDLTGDASGSSGSCTGQAATVATIAGLAPNTATTQATQGNITTLASVSSIGAGILDVTSSAIRQYKASNDGNPMYRVGSSDANEVIIQALYHSGAQTLESINFYSTTAGSSADDGKFLFYVDALAALQIDDGGIDFLANHGISIAGTDILTDSSGTATLSNIDALDATTLATINSKSRACFPFIGYGTSDGTNYEMPELLTDSKAPFEHDTSSGSDGLTAQTVLQVIRGGGIVMPYTGVLKKFTGWVASAGSGTVDVGIFKFTPVDNNPGDLTPVLLVNEQITATGNTKMRSFSETSSFDAGFTAGDIIYSAVLGGSSGKSWYLNSTLEVEWS